jgi:hypothetical protein
MANKPTTAPDNNKRLALLEAGVAALAIALTANGFTLEAVNNPIDEAIKAIKSLLTERSALSAKVAELEAALAAGPDGATEGEIAAIARADKAEEDLKAATAELEELRTDVGDLEARIDELSAQLPPPPDPVNLAAERPEGARDFGPTFGKIDTADLGALVESGAAFEIAFSNGAHEILELAPVAVPAGGLIGRAGRFVAPTIYVRGGERGEAIHGAVLVHDGAQIDYCEFQRPLPIEPRQERRFENSIAFG